MSEWLFGIGELCSVVRGGVAESVVTGAGRHIVLLMHSDSKLNGAIVAKLQGDWQTTGSYACDQRLRFVSHLVVFSI